MNRKSNAVVSIDLRTRFTEVLDFLTSVGLILKQADRYLPGTTLLHLGKDSPTIYQHHANWRLKALSVMPGDVAQRNLHYSTVVTLSAEDAQKVRAVLTQAISDSATIIKASQTRYLKSSRAAQQVE